MVGLGILAWFLTPYNGLVGWWFKSEHFRYQAMVRGSREGRRMQINAQFTWSVLLVSTVHHCSHWVISLYFCSGEWARSTHRDPKIAKHGLSANESELGSKSRHHTRIMFLGFTLWIPLP